MKISNISLVLLALATIASSPSVAQAPTAPPPNPSSEASPAAAICPIVYPLDENPTAHGYQYAFHGNAFFINRDGYLITAAHVLHSFRIGGDPHILVQRGEAPPQMLKAEVVLEDREH